MTKPFKPRPPIDEDRYRERMPGALEEIGARGHLLLFEPDRTERLALMQVLSTHGLISWHRVLAKYVLTEAGTASLTEQERRRA